MAQTRIILADDHRMFAEGLKRSLEPEHAVIAIVDSGEQLVDAVIRLKPEIAIADISMGGLNGIEAARQIRERRPAVRIILLTMHEDPVYATTALEAGVSGFVLKNAPLSELLRAIRDASTGNTYLAPSIARMVFQLRRQKGQSPQPGTPEFTPQQREILRLLAEGNTIKQAAADLAVSSKTIEYHKYRLMRQLGVKTTAELVRYAARMGIVSA